MDGSFESGWYQHNTLGKIKVFVKDTRWYYQCYKTNGSKPLSNPKPIDQWTWAMCEKDSQ